MHFNRLHIMLLFIVCVALAACTDEGSSIVSPDSGKIPIELSVGGMDAQEPITRAVVTDGTGKTMQNFDVNTKIFMIMKSEYSALPSPHDYLNFGGDQTTKYTVSRGDVTANTNAVVFDDKNKKYWDDAHARSSKLNIWAYAQKGMSRTPCSFAVDDAGSNPPYRQETFYTDNYYGWRTTAIYPMIFNWKVSHRTGADSNKQDATTVMCQDLLFSNNLVNNSSTGTNIGGSDARLAFNPSVRKFPQEGEALMKFYHAMSKITVKVIEGDGFNTSSTSDFQFKSGTNVKLTGFNTEGLFSIQAGGFQQINAHADIPSIYLKATNTSAAPYYTLEALAVPNIDEFTQTYVPAQNDDFSRFVKDKKDYSTDVMMEFVIDDNKYQVTSGQLYEALVDGSDNPVANAVKKTNNGTYIPLEAGKNYVFTFIVGKTRIKNITAQVADWENVNADNVTPSNARIKLQLEERGTAQSSDVAFYKANDNKTSDGIDDNYTTWNWKTGYSNLGATYSIDHWTTNYFWESNKDFYHFRALMPASTGVVTDAGDGDYADITSGVSYTDLRWGAPMKDDGDNETLGSFKWTYNPTSTGFDNAGHSQIYKAIGPTEDPVKLILFHMMSDLTFNIKTTAGTDKVELCHDNGNGTYARARLDLVGYFNDGKVLLGTGLVKTVGSASSENSPVNIPFASAVDNSQYVQQVYSFGAIPQDLNNVVLVVTTPDNNQYKIKMKDVLAASGAVSSYNIANPYSKDTSGKYIINRWYPGFRYTYSFTLKKTGITDLEATIVDWETVSAGDDNVTIE